MQEREQPINQNPPTVHGILKNGSKEEILKMLRNQVDPGSVDENGDTLLHAMMCNKNLLKLDVIELLSLFLAQGVEPNIKNKLGLTVLHFAIAKRSKDAINVLLKSEADIHVANECGHTLAHFFIRFEYIKFKSIDETVKSLEAFENESLSFLEFLISANLDFDRKNNRGRSALRQAMTYSLQHFFPTLLARTNDVNIVDESNDTLLAILLDNCTSTRRSRLFNGNQYSRYDSSFVVRCMEMLFERGAPLPIYDKYDKSLLRKAFEEKHEAVVIKTLIGHYLKTCIDAHSATTLLQELIDTCAWWDTHADTDYFLAVVSELTAKGADVNEPNQAGRRPVHAAIGANDFRVIKFLHQNGAALNVKSPRGKNLLHLLAERKSSVEESSSRDYRSEVWYLITDGGCEMNLACDRGDSPLRSAFARDNVPVALALLNLGADVDCRDANSRTALHEAVGLAVKTPSGSPEFVRFLLSNGADADAPDFKGDTPLHLAAYEANLPIVRLLIEHGASVRSRDKHFLDTPLHRAVLIGNCQTTSESLSVVELLLASGADVNAEDRQGNTPLMIHCSVPDARASIVRALLERGASANCRDRRNMESPLHRAARKAGRTAEIVELLLENGADANARDNEGKTPLQAHLAAEHVDEAIVRSLLKHGASVNVKDERMETPLHRVVFNSAASPAMVELLLENGADPNARNIEGNAPLRGLFHRWAEGGDRILEMLLANGASVNARNNGEQSALFYVQSTRRARSDDDDRKLHSLLSRHGLKLKAAKLPLDGEYGAYVNRNHDRGYYEECCAEVERLESVLLVDGSVSLYDFLRACPGRRGALYAKSEKLQRLVGSDEFVAEFPEYSALILVGCREAAMRHTLLGSAEEAFHRLANVQLPDCIELVLGYLTGVDLANIIEASRQLS